MSKNQDGYIRLVKAIMDIRARYPWVPVESLRDAVRNGVIPSKRTSLNRKAHYLVRLEDMEKYVAQLTTKQ